MVLQSNYSFARDKAEIKDGKCYIEPRKEYPRGSYWALGDEKDKIYFKVLNNLLKECKKNDTIVLKAKSSKHYEVLIYNFCQLQERESFSRNEEFSCKARNFNPELTPKLPFKVYKGFGNRVEEMIIGHEFEFKTAPFTKEEKDSIYKKLMKLPEFIGYSSDKNLGMIETYFERLEKKLPEPEDYDPFNPDKDRLENRKLALDSLDKKEKSFFFKRKQEISENCKYGGTCFDIKTSKINIFTLVGSRCSKETYIGSTRTSTTSKGSTSLQRNFGTSTTMTLESRIEYYMGFNADSGICYESRYTPITGQYNENPFFDFLDYPYGEKIRQDFNNLEASLILYAEYGTWEGDTRHYSTRDATLSNPTETKTYRKKLNFSIAGIMIENKETKELIYLGMPESIINDYF